MIRYMLIFLAALLLAAFGTPLARRLALALGVVDLPAARKLHAQPVPLLGGVAIYAGVLLALVFLGDLFFVSQLAAIVLGATIVSLCGVFDDKWGLRPLVKLGFQLAATAFLIVSGIYAQLLPWPEANYALTALWVVGITNATNLLDNMDGLSGGVAAVAAAFFLIMSAGSGQFLVASLAAALLGACLGFLLYNFNPATIFMGDTGSLFLGFVLAAVGIKLRFPLNVPQVTWMVPVIVLGIPVFDTTLVTVSRLRRRVPISQGGKDHLSHRLVRLGLTGRESVMAIYLIGGGLGMFALFITQAELRDAYAVAGGLFLLAVAALIWLERVPAVDPAPVAGEALAAPSAPAQE